MAAEEIFEGFEKFNQRYEKEVQERWGKTDAYQESMRRTKGYSKDDWKRFKAEAEAAGKRWIDLKASGIAATDVRAMDHAEAARLQIDRWFYPCSLSRHRGLADLYESDPRFTANYEKMAPGMAAFVATAIRVNADRQEKG